MSELNSKSQNSYKATLVLFNDKTRFSESYFHISFTQNKHQPTNPPSLLLPPPPDARSAEPIFRESPSRKILFLLSFLSLISLSKTNDLQSLLKFKTSLLNSNTNVFNTWTPNQNSICNFTGITCNSNQTVKEINLSQQNISGTLPLDAICSLQSIEKLSLGSNSLYGIVTEELSNCTKLQYLDLGMNSYTGKFPDLSSLTQLKFLNLNHSGFSSQFPWKSLENLTSLEFLSLGDNPFDWSPFPLEILNLHKLYQLSYNQLSGKIPEGITKLKNLWQLELYSNQLSGKFPNGFGNLTNLINFDASTNSLEGDLSEIKYLTKLVSLQLFENKFSGEIPIELGEFKSLTNLSLYTNKLTGSIPPNIGSYGNFTFIDVTENFLTGSIPPNMCKNGKMRKLLMLQNKFTGGLPENYANCLSLNRLRVNNNSLSGKIPAGIWSLPHLSIIDLTMNQFEGPLSNNVGEAKSLAQLFLSHNQFSGELPATISESTSLVDIELGSNQFSGEIPSTIGNLKKLSNLHLENNLFSGTIPESLGSCVSLSDINLARNSFSGKIPASIGSLRSLNSLNLSHNELSGEIPVSLSSLKLSILDLSNNRAVTICYNPVINLWPCSSDSSKSSNVRTVVSCFVAGAAVLFVSLECFMYVNSLDMKQFHMLSFTEEEVMNAIKKENLIGKGGSGNVYKVMLRNGKQLAVKHIWKSDSGDRRSFRSSSAMIPKGNLRSLEYDAKVATLHHMPECSEIVLLHHKRRLESAGLRVPAQWEFVGQVHTCQKIQMDWEVRYEIVVGAAKGLEYLHHGYDRPVIHRDVKTSNILLDEQLKPKIADFGLAKVVQPNGVWDSTHIIAGTHGYIAPEYAYTSKVNEKSDVHSFGVVLMELVMGKRPVEPEFGENKDIVQWVCGDMRSKGSSIHLVDTAISEAMKEDAARVLRIAVHCTMKTPALRPSMRMVVQMLEETEPCNLTSIIVSKGGENNKS
ncbi:Receptor-like protein kinase 7 [Camellia lanceoleosa]|uniref:Receptor-like protein kinase 7 n=1 Tax=Camellia lanceoleosa TaxID=1840588 RepID=A0ACC0IPV0_9ERIC|nr:Receptor-like protein kinase 7 [Camellia lanceoleosa]